MVFPFLQRPRPFSSLPGTAPEGFGMPGATVPEGTDLATESDKTDPTLPAGVHPNRLPLPAEMVGGAPAVGNLAATYTKDPGGPPPPVVVPRSQAAGAEPDVPLPVPSADTSAIDKAGTGESLSPWQKAHGMTDPHYGPHGFKQRLGQFLLGLARGGGIPEAVDRATGEYAKQEGEKDFTRNLQETLGEAQYNRQGRMDDMQLEEQRQKGQMTEAQIEQYRAQTAKLNRPDPPFAFGKTGAGQGVIYNKQTGQPGQVVGQAPPPKPKPTVRPSIIRHDGNVYTLDPATGKETLRGKDTSRGGGKADSSAVGASPDRHYLVHTGKSKVEFGKVLADTTSKREAEDQWLATHSAANAEPEEIRQHSENQRRLSGKENNLMTRRERAEAAILKDEQKGATRRGSSGGGQPAAKNFGFSAEEQQQIGALGVPPEQYYVWKRRNKQGTPADFAATVKAWRDSQGAGAQ